ncbi:MAG: outer membrane protein transport protein [Steroidobacteraceae bacterium]
MRSITRSIGPAVALAAGALGSVTHAAGFGVIEQSASGLGAAFAGSAAQVNDASVQYFNPAGLALIERAEVSAAVHALDVGLEFTDSGSTLPPAGLGALPRGATRDDAGDTLFVPNLHVAYPFAPGLVAGLSVSVPYGLKTEYSDPWVGRFQGLFSELKTLNVNPAIAWKLSDQVSLGVGASWQKAEAELTNAVMLGAATEGRARLKGDDSAWGWNAGVLLTPHESMRIGVGYRSRIDYNLTGDAAVTTVAGAPVAAASGPASVAIDMPEQGYFSLAQKFGDRFTLLADASFTSWGRVDELRVLNPGNGATRDLLTFNFRDTWRFALGGEYVLDERWTLRAGAALDESPVPDGARNVRLPDQDRTWVTVGAQWRMNERFRFDAGYAHLFVKDATVSLARPQLGGPASFTSVVNGKYESSVNIFSLQLSYSL